MNEGIYLYPRLDPVAAMQAVHDQGPMPLADLRALGTVAHTSASPAATGGIPAPPAGLVELQKLLRDMADDFDFPATLNTERQQEFDRRCGTLLFQKMRIVPGDAAEEGVWSFITLVLVPEIGPWRFPDRHLSRLLGKQRNVFRRLWWRAWSLGPDLTHAPTGNTPLNEDDFFQIMERTRLSGDRRTAQAIKRQAWQIELHAAVVNKLTTRNKILRETIKRLRAARSHLALNGLDDTQLASLLEDFTKESIIAVLGSADWKELYQRT